MATPDLGLIEKKIRVKFQNQKLLEEAFTHKSYSIEHNIPTCNERLEFLGDSIISAVVAHWLFKKFPNVDEGKLRGLLQVNSILDVGNGLSYNGEVGVRGGEDVWGVSGRLGVRYEW